MSNDNKTSNAETIKTASEIDLIPVLPGEGVQKDKMSKIPFTEFSALGIAASGFVDAFRTASQTTNSLRKRRENCNLPFIRQHYCCKQAL